MIHDSIVLQIKQNVKSNQWKKINGKINHGLLGKCVFDFVEKNIPDKGTTLSYEVHAPQDDLIVSLLGLDGHRPSNTLLNDTSDVNGLTLRDVVVTVKPDTNSLATTILHAQYASGAGSQTGQITVSILSYKDDQQDYIGVAYVKHYRKALAQRVLAPVTPHLISRPSAYLGAIKDTIKGIDIKAMNSDELADLVKGLNQLLYWDGLDIVRINGTALLDQRELPASLAAYTWDITTEYGDEGQLYTCVENKTLHFYDDTLGAFEITIYDYDDGEDYDLSDEILSHLAGEKANDDNRDDIQEKIHGMISDEDFRQFSRDVYEYNGDCFWVYNSALYKKYEQAQAAKHQAVLQAKHANAVVA